MTGDADLMVKATRTKGRLVERKQADVFRGVDNKHKKNRDDKIKQYNKFWGSSTKYVAYRCSVSKSYLIGTQKDHTFGYQKQVPAKLKDKLF